MRKEPRPWKVETEFVESPLWRSVAKFWQLVVPGLFWAVGNGRNVRFWEDR